MPSLKSFLFMAAAMAALVLTPALRAANEPVLIKKVDFTTARLPGVGQEDEWIEIAIELQGGPNDNKNARNPAFNENIKVDFFLCYEVEPEPGAKTKGPTLYHFKSGVEISALERGKTVDVQFFIPPEIKRLYRLPSSRAFAHAVIVSVDGQELKPQSSGDALSNKVNNPERLKSFRDQCDQKSVESKGVMVPVYETLFWNASLDGGKRLKNVPSYRKQKGL